MRSCLLWFCIAGTALGADLTHGPLNFVMRNWQVEDGLPANEVNAIVQTHDGYIWMATFSGLARFDGQEFKIYNDINTPELQTSAISSIYEDKSGNLWIGHETGELTRYKGGRFEAVAISPKWKRTEIWRIGADEAGDIWLVNEVGLLYRVRDALMLSPIPGSALGFYSFEQNNEGSMWIGRNGVMSTPEAGHLKIMPFDEPSLTNSYFQGACSSLDGGLWVVSEGRLRKWKNNEWVEDLGVCPSGFASISGMIEMRSGLLALGTPDHGLYLIQPHGETVCFNHTNRLRSDWVTSLCEDREGNLWVGTSAAGLVMLRAGNFLTLNPPDGWQDRSVLSVAAGLEGGLWIGSDGGGVYHYFNGNWTNWGVSDGVSNPYVWSVAADLPGKVLLGTWDGGLFVQHGNRFETAPGWQDNFTTVTALLRRGDGGYWVGGVNGLDCYQNGKIIPLLVKGIKPFADVRAILEEKDGTLWVGMNGRGLGCLQNGQLHVYRKGDGLAGDFVDCLHLDDDGSLWIGTYDGLSRLKKGYLTTITTDNGLPDNTICDIEDDGLGYFWLSTHEGIIRVQKEELNRCADGLAQSVNCLCFGKSDGLPTQECSGGFQPAGCVTTNGWLYFPTSKGLVAVEPDALKTNPFPPPVVIEELLVDGKVIPREPAANSPLEIPPGRHQFEFQYAALSFAATDKNQFKYRIDGLDSKWVNAGTKREMDYSYIPPGQYTFHVVACNNDGVWNEDGASLAFTVLPYFWQTMWFRVLGLIVVIITTGGGVWYDTRRRLHQRLERLERQRTVERERARIARDIHDDLGASLTRINLLSQSARQNMDAHPEDAVNDLSHICDTARQLTQTMGEIVWAVDPQHDTLDSLASYVGKLTNELLGASAIRCRLEIPRYLPSWPLTAEIRHNLVLAFKEALHNVIKHSSATEVSISFVPQMSGVAVNILDNGCGFDSDAPADKTLVGREQRPRRNGLANMRQRMQEIGGYCEIQSERGRGTNIKFFVPVTEAAK